MAEKRMLPDYTDNESFGQLSPDAALLLMMMRIKADNYGRLVADPGMLAGLCFRHRQDVSRESIERCLADLERHGFIVLYEVGLGRYLALVDWDGRVRGTPVYPARAGEQDDWLPTSKMVENQGQNCVASDTPQCCGDVAAESSSPSSPPAPPYLPPTPTHTSGRVGARDGRLKPGFAGVDRRSEGQSGDDAGLLMDVNAQRNKMIRGRFIKSAPTSVDEVQAIMKGSVWAMSVAEGKLDEIAQACYEYYKDGYTSTGGFVKDWRSKAEQWLKNECVRSAEGVLRAENVRGRGGQRTAMRETIKIKRKEIRDV